LKTWAHLHRPRPILLCALWPSCTSILPPNCFPKN
jgi:hypothetical protein